MTLRKASIILGISHKISAGLVRGISRSRIFRQRTSLSLTPISQNLPISSPLYTRMASGSEGETKVIFESPYSEEPQSEESRNTSASLTKVAIEVKINVTDEREASSKSVVNEEKCSGSQQPRNKESLSFSFKNNEHYKVTGISDRKARYKEDMEKASFKSKRVNSDAHKVTERDRKKEHLSAPGNETEDSLKSKRKRDEDEGMEDQNNSDVKRRKGNEPQYRDSKKMEFHRENAADKRHKSERDKDSSKQRPATKFTRPQDHYCTTSSSDEEPSFSGYKSKGSGRGQGERKLGMSRNGSSKQKQHTLDNFVRPQDRYNQPSPAGQRPSTSGYHGRGSGQTYGNRSMSTNAGQPPHHGDQPQQRKPHKNIKETSQQLLGKYKDYLTKVRSERHYTRIFYQDPQMDRAADFEFFFGSNGPFSQHYTQDVLFREGELTFCCAEQYMMYKKADLFKDEYYARCILNTRDPREMKKFGRKVRGFNGMIWEQHSEDIVKLGNRYKFTQNIGLLAILFSTYPKILVEASPRDNLWGIGLGRDRPEAHCRLTWKGRNKLGFILTDLRNELMRERKLLQ